jgi:hypothetical protein
MDYMFSGVVYGIGMWEISGMDMMGCRPFYREFIHILGDSIKTLSKDICPLMMAFTGSLNSVDVGLTDQSCNSRQEWALDLSILLRDHFILFVYLSQRFARGST